MLKRILFAWLSVILIKLSVTAPVAAQEEAEPLQALPAEPVLAVVDRQGATIDGLTDGDEVRFRLTSPVVAEKDRTLSFYLAPDDYPVGECRILAAETECITGPVAARGWYWSGDGQIHTPRTVYAIDYAATGWLPIAETEIDIAPRPVVMVHGLQSTYAAWTNYLGPAGFLARIGVPGYAVGDGQAPGVMNTGYSLRPAQPTNTIARNAEILEEYIDGIKAQTGAEQVDLLVHSMGGLIARYYIDRLMTDRDVAQLIMLGTPNGGSDCAVMAGRLGLFQPAALELRTSYLEQVFNPQISATRGVPFYVVAGTLIQQRIVSPCGDVPNDTVVSRQSTVAVEAELVDIPLIHSDLNSSATVFEAHVAPRLRKSPAAFAQPLRPATLPTVDEADMLQFSRVTTGTVPGLPAGEVGNHHTIHIDREVAVAGFGLYDPTRSLTVTVEGATGNVIELSPVEHGLTVLKDPQSLLYMGYGFENPRPGPWGVTVHATSQTPPMGAEYALITLYTGGARISAAISDPLPEIGQPVTLTATLMLGEEALDFDQGETLLQHPDGEVERVLMAQGGTSLTAELIPEAPGVYGVDVNMSAVLDDGTVVERAIYLAFEAR